MGTKGSGIRGVDIVPPNRLPKVKLLQGNFKNVKIGDFSKIKEFRNIKIRDFYENKHNNVASISFSLVRV